MLVPQHIVSQLADADPALGVSFPILDVQGSLLDQPVQGQGYQVRHGGVFGGAGSDGVADVEDEEGGEG